MFKYLFSDIDGTLLQSGVFNEDTINKIHNFINEGNQFILATGRIDSDIIAIQNKLGINPPYRISQNGAVVTKGDSEVIHEIGIPTSNLGQLTDYLFSVMAKYNFVLEVSFQQRRYSNTKRPIGINHAFTTPIIHDDKLKERALDDPILFLILSENESCFAEIANHIQKNFSRLQAVKTSEGCLEILHRQATKGNAIEVVLRDLGILSKEHVYVVGDSYNDISMFKKFKNSFVMSTSPTDVEKYANYRANVVGEVVDFINNLKN